MPGDRVEDEVQSADDPYAMAKVGASRPNARGAASEAMSTAAMTANIAMRTSPSSGSSVLVSQA
jgi:hypothetical protein